MPGPGWPGAVEPERIVAAVPGSGNLAHTLRSGVLTPAHRPVSTGWARRGGETLCGFPCGRGPPRRVRRGGAGSGRSRSGSPALFSGYRKPALPQCVYGNTFSSHRGVCTRCVKISLRFFALGNRYAISVTPACMSRVERLVETASRAAAPPVPGSYRRASRQTHAARKSSRLVTVPRPAIYD